MLREASICQLASKFFALFAVVNGARLRFTLRHNSVYVFSLHFRVKLDVSCVRLSGLDRYFPTLACVGVQKSGTSTLCGCVHSLQFNDWNLTFAQPNFIKMCTHLLPERDICILQHSCARKRRDYVRASLQSISISRVSKWLQGVCPKSAFES
jgi:hypothetical protein